MNKNKSSTRINQLTHLFANAVIWSYRSAQCDTTVFGYFRSDKADTLDGFHESHFLNTSTATQTKLGRLELNTTGMPGTGALAAIADHPTAGYFENTSSGSTAQVATNAYGIEAAGYTCGGRFDDIDGDGWARVAVGNVGIEAEGSQWGARFEDSDGSGYANVGEGDTGIRAFGNTSGGYFEDLDGSGYSYVGYGGFGVSGHGTQAGGFFEDTDSSGRAEVGYWDYGIRASGTSTGGYFYDSDSTGSAFVGKGDRGIEAKGSEMGGYFWDNDLTSNASVASGGIGIDATGSIAGGSFYDSDASGHAYVANGDYGILGYGDISGGFFDDSNNSGFAHVGYGDWGIDARGNAGGGVFVDSDGSGWAYVGYIDEGISAHGNVQGGYFEDSDDGSYAHVAYGGLGIAAAGPVAGGRFEDIGSDAVAILATGDVGISADGFGAGGLFRDTTSTAWARVAEDYSGINYKIRGSGQVSFVQNHPEDENRVIVYTAPEGDETAVYTRGTARLVEGEARVALGETFKWVANPDVGLTAHLTARGEPVPLAVVELTPREMVVRAPSGYPDVVFDYLVYGLRIGFERSEVVQVKEQEALLPMAGDGGDPYSTPIPTGAATAFERFMAMTSEVRGTPEGDIGLDGARELRGRIEATGWQDLRFSGSNVAGEQPENGPADVGPSAVPKPGVPRESEAGPSGPAQAGTIAAADRNSESPEDSPPAGHTFPTMVVSEAVETGDVLVLDLEQPGSVRRSFKAADTGVVGIVADGGQAAWRSEAPVAVYGLATIRVDASYGAVLAGDLLTSSPTPGHAMRAVAAAPGTVVGKALEPLETGTGLIRVLVMPR